MTDNTALTIHPRHARQRQRVLGKTLQHLYASFVAEPVRADLLLLLEQADNRQSLVPCTT